MLVNLGENEKPREDRLRTMGNTTVLSTDTQSDEDSEVERAEAFIGHT